MYRDYSDGFSLLKAVWKIKINNLNTWILLNSNPPISYKSLGNKLHMKLKKNVFLKTIYPLFKGIAFHSVAFLVKTSHLFNPDMVVIFT